MAFRGVSGTAGSVNSSQVVGNTTGAAAPAGVVGEVISAVLDPASSVALTTNVTANIITLPVTKGTWLIGGYLELNPNAATTTSLFRGGISATSATQPARKNGQGFVYNTPLGAGLFVGLPILPTLFQLAANANIFLVGDATFAVNTNSAYGFIQAVRIF